MYAWVVFTGTMLVSIIIAYFLGLSWFLFLPAVLLIWFPVVMMAGYIKVLIPPKIKQFYPEDLSLNQGNKL